MTHPLYDLVRQNAAPDAPYLHVVGYSFLPTTTPEQIKKVKDDCVLLYEKCGGHDAGIISWTVADNVDPRKGFVLVEIAMFSQREAFIAWHAHPEHTAYASEVAQIADKWIVLDVVTTEPVPITALVA